MKTSVVISTLFIFGAIQQVFAEVLFDGKNLDHFEFAKGSWEIEKDGSVVCRMQEQKDARGKTRIRGMGYLWTKREFADFELSLSYKLSHGANTGVFYRTDKLNPVQGGFEIQLMDNEGFQKKAKKKLPPRKLNGSFYDGLAPIKDFSKPVGEWNAFRLLCNGPLITCHINGGKSFSINLENWDVPGKNPDGSANKFKNALKQLPRKGRIGFQNHGQVVRFKNIVIRSLR
ncbi:MAG: hypothetical protein CMI26_08415 [Opitutae bacterium]|nr:hypothetical protein [Opitutae bacterium]